MFPVQTNNTENRSAATCSIGNFSPPPGFDHYDAVTPQTQRGTCRYVVCGVGADMSP